MSQSLSFTLNCVPTAQMRPKHATINGIHCAYKAKGQKANEATLEALLAPFVPDKPLEGALSLYFAAYFPVPKSASKKQRYAMLAGIEAHTKKPDLDNLAKQLKDAMTRLQFWHDDKQVVRLYCGKHYGEYGRWAVEVKELDGEAA